MSIKWFSFLFALLMLGSASYPVWAQGLVKITPLGSHDGEFCANDRALLFEDPKGLRILYDPGKTLAGAADPRLHGVAVHVMILTSVHADHIGDEKAAGRNAGSCSAPGTVGATPHSNFVEIAVAKKSTVVVGGEMAGYLSAQLSHSGATLAGCPAVENLTVTDPPTDLRSCILRHGGKRVVRLAKAGEGVQIAIIRADHSNGIPRSLLNNQIATMLEPDNLTAYGGPENGYVLTFSNGLVVYLSGDTGHTSDMATIVNEYYKANLAVIHMGDIFTMGPEEAAFAVNRLIKPKAVIPEHANEAATAKSSVRPGTRTARFIDLVKGIPVHIPLSGVVMRFNGEGRCVAGC